jgi:Xaa-Pro aminopeptidase
MNLTEIQRALADAGIDGWLFCDFHHRDLMAYKILGLDAEKMTSRRWFYFVPARGEPVKLSHRVEPRRLDPLPGRQEFYLAWTELHEKLRGIVAGQGKIAMQYSPMNNIPYVSVVDAGTVELVRSFGPEVVSSADLVQRFEALHDGAALATHRRAGDVVQAIKDEAYDRLARALADGTPITEFEVMQFILSRFEEQGMTSDGAVPIVGFNDHPADPHFEPTRENAYTLAAGDMILIDLWARHRQPSGLYYDITWCGFAGTEPPTQYVEIFDTVRRARDAAVEFVRRSFASGETCHGYEVDRVCRKVVDDAGYGDAFLHRTGHNIGVDVHGNGVNIDDLETRDDRRLVPGVCFSVEPGIYLPGSMAVRSEINVFVTPKGSVEVHGPMQQELLLLG